MAKIVAINPEIISIGMDNGELKEVPASSINFVPHIGDEVEIFESTNNIIVSKIEKKTEPAVVQQPPVQNIPNIVINNANNNVNTNTNINGGIQGKPKNKWVALILCIFLGFFGAHKFYEGKIGMGVLYIFTCGLFFVGVIIDAIAILTKPNPYYV